MAENQDLKSITFPSERKADLCIGGFNLWVYGRQFPTSDDYWDGNWLDVTAHCAEDFATVQTGGPILHLSEVHGLMIQCKQVYNSLSGEVHLACMEPNIDLKITMKSRGHCELAVSITPNHLYQNHLFLFDLDQSHLLPFIESLEKLLRSYPLKGAE